MTSASDRPVSVAVINDHELIVRGVGSMLTPYSDLVRVVELDADLMPVTPVDIALYDTFTHTSLDEPDLARHPTRLVGDGERGQPRRLGRAVGATQGRSREPRVEDGACVEGEQAEAVCGARGHGVKGRGRSCARPRASGSLARAVRLGRVVRPSAPSGAAARVDVCRSTSRPTLSP